MITLTYRTTTTSVVDGYWHHVCITWAKNGVYEVFKDGKLIGFGSGLYNEETQSIPGKALNSLHCLVLYRYLLLIPPVLL